MKKILRFIRTWSLPTSIFIGAVVYLLFAFLPFLDDASRVMSPVFDAILPLFMFLILFVTFCKVNFRQLMPVKWHLWVSIFQIIFVLCDVAVILLFKLKGDHLILAEALLTCIIGPCAAAAAVVTVKLGGSLEEMTTYTFLSNFITAVLIPVIFPLIDKAVNMSFLSAFLLILYKVCLILVLPMLLAYIVKHHLKSLHRRIVSLKDAGFYMWCCSLTIVSGTTVKNIVHANTTIGFLLLIAVLALGVCILQFTVGRALGRHSGRVIEAGQALGQKNTAFAIWISYTYLTPLSSVGPGCYILWQNIINSIELWSKTRKEVAKS